MNLGVLLADRATDASTVWSDTQSKAAPLWAWTIRGPEAISTGHRGEPEIQSLAMECAGDNESFPNLVDCIHVLSLAVKRLRADHTQPPVRLQQLPPAQVRRVVSLIRRSRAAAPRSYLVFCSTWATKPSIDMTPKSSPLRVRIANSPFSISRSPATNR